MNRNRRKLKRRPMKERFKGNRKAKHERLLREANLYDAIPAPPLFSDRTPLPAPTNLSNKFLTSKTSAFVPVSPLASPYCTEILPSPSGYSTAATEDTTDRTFTPTSELLDSNFPQSPGYGPRRVVSPLSTPRKSPKKSSRRGRDSPYSPSAESVGSVSTSDETFRHHRAKTELCTHFLRSGTCPYGSGCSFAHGEAELQKTKLIDLQEQGLIDDIDSYRTKPCWTWVSTGSWYVSYPSWIQSFGLLDTPAHFILTFLACSFPLIANTIALLENGAPPSTTRVLLEPSPVGSHTPKHRETPFRQTSTSMACIKSVLLPPSIRLPLAKTFR